MHCSKLPQLFACPSSQLPAERPYDPPSEAGDLGTAVHEALADVVDGEDPDVASIASRHGVGTADVAVLTSYGRQAWDEVRGLFADAVTEHRLAGDGLSGRADVFSWTDGGAAVLDWKTNRARANVRPQLHGYGACVAEQHGIPEFGPITLVTVWLRLGELDITTMTATCVARFREDLERVKARVGVEYGPGDACTFCRRQLECEARRDYLRSAAGALEVVGAGALPDKDTLLALYPRAQLLTKALDQYRQALRMTLRETGPLTDGNGNRYELAETRRESIKAREAWPVLVEHGFTEDDLAACCEIKTTAMLDAAAKHAPRGEKGKRKAYLRQLLRERGAVTQTIHDTVRVSKGVRQ